MGCLYIRVRLKMWLCLKTRFSTFFDITWYVKQPLIQKKFLFSHSIVCYFYWIRQGRWQIKIEKVWQRLMEWKPPLCKWYTFWMAPWLICCFTVILLHIERKCHLKTNFATILILKFKLSGKFKRFNASIEMLNSWISKNFN